ncbi:MAG: UvrB/UvrC motif-containing protein [Clostridia bacterium]|nr:UvrB/UvrC motif-containing protein [Clostridia bacterium]
MICQMCGKNEADTRIKTIVNGDMTQLELCSACAARAGYESLFSGTLFGRMMSELSPFAALSDMTDGVLRCETCGMTEDELLSTGRAGCPDCYTTFRARLDPLIKKLRGAAGYEGRVPGTDVKQEAAEDERLISLRERLARAIEEEDYETAALLRDEMRGLSGEDMA